MFARDDIDVLALAAIAQAAPSQFAGAQNATGAHEMRAVEAKCAPVSSAVPLLRAYNPVLKDHFYTTDSGEMQRAPGYIIEGSVGRVWSTQADSTVPLYRLFSGIATDHFYTTSAYGPEADAGYVYPSQMCGAVPLYCLYSSGATDHFYTISKTERAEFLKNGYVDNGMAGYVLSYP
ncbi:hypothetical protein BD779DRAFT_1560661 [Infundibulicybe gibba]|nr:hypothetical protein BD779DRAFT_1560661 [Infundibulicybe gibba]